MISKKYIKDLDFKTIEDIFNYIVESEINGNYSQVKELINKLNKKQFKKFCIDFENTEYYNTKPLSWFIEKRK
jgi:hypothetical protein